MTSPIAEGREQAQRYALDKDRVGLVRDATGNWVQITDHWTVCLQRDALVAALEKFVTAAKSWHTFHHGSELIQCDLLCECIAPGEAALNAAKEPS